MTSGYTRGQFTARAIPSLVNLLAMIYVMLNAATAQGSGASIIFSIGLFVTTFGLMVYACARRGCAVGWPPVLVAIAAAVSAFSGVLLVILFAVLLYLPNRPVDGQPLATPGWPSLLGGAMLWLLWPWPLVFLSTQINR